MPFVSIPIDARKKLLENARELRAAKAADEQWKMDHLTSWATGFFDCLRCEYPSETVGLLVMDYDDVLENGTADEDTFTELLPRIVFGQG